MRKLLLSLCALVLAAPAYALPINSPVPSDAYITFDGLDWAWGGPCPYSGGCFATGDLTYQSTQGWRLPTISELESLPSNFANHFVFPGADVPLGGTDPVSGALFEAGTPPGAAACASPYFDTAATWCDWNDGAGGLWAGLPGAPDFAEQLYVRGAAAVPEPIGLAVLASGLLGIGIALRRRSTR